MIRRTLLALTVAGCSSAPPAMPDPALPLADWSAADRVLDSAIAAHAAPGAVLGVSWRRVRHVHSVGRLGADAPQRPNAATVYDLASLTKVVGLTSVVMHAVRDSLIVLDAPVERCVPSFTGAGKERVTLRHLLTHSSGLPAWRPLFRESDSRASAFALADTTPLDTLPAGRMVYSDLGAIVLTQCVEHLYRARLDSLLAAGLFSPLQMQDTRYLPPSSWQGRIAPTENDPWRGRVLRGEMHNKDRKSVV